MTNPTSQIFDSSNALLSLSSSPHSILRGVVFVNCRKSLYFHDITLSMGSSATLNMASLIKFMPVSSSKLKPSGEINYGFHFKGSEPVTRICAISSNGSVSRSASSGAESSSVGDVHRRRSSLESLFCYDKPIPEERIEKPVGISLAEKNIGDNARCDDCHAKGAVLCATCSGSGLYVDSILESQGILVKVRCLGCGGSGNIMCSECGGRGHLGPK